MPTLDDFHSMVEMLAARARRERAARAALERALRRKLDESPQTVSLVAAWLPKQPDPDTDDGVLLAAALAAKYPDLHRRRVGLGTALATARVSGGDRRLAAAVRSDQTLLCTRHLPDLAEMVARAGGQLDVGLLGWQAATWTFRGDETGRRWLRDYYRAAARSGQSGDSLPASP